MPLPGDQHRDTAASINPFAPPPPRISEWTAQEIATLQSRLDKQLGPEFISTRPGAGGGKVHYLAAEKVINLANDVFGFNGWSSSIQNVQIDFCDEHVQTGKITLGLSTIVRVTLRDGTYHEDIGYGHIENCKGKAAAFEKAKKEAATDALKRALRNFGNMLGNCLYDKDYLQKVTKIKIAPSKWDEVNLHRHHDFAPKSAKEIAKPPTRTISAQSNGSAMFEDDFETNIFDDTDFTNPDASRASDGLIDTPQHALSRPHASRASDGHTDTPQHALSKQLPSINRANPDASCASDGHIDTPAQHAISKQLPPINRAISMPHLRASPQPPKSDLATHEPDDAAWQPPVPRDPPPNMPQGFISGKAVDALDKPPEARPPEAQMAFDPHIESPGIRRTHGVNPGKSAPVKLTALGRAVTPGANGFNGPAVNVRTNFVNPSADPNRKVGMPPTPNRGAYKPPTAIKRPALADVSNLQQPENGDAKKPKLDVSEQSETIVVP